MSEAEGSESFIERQRYELAALKVFIYVFYAFFFLNVLSRLSV